MTAPIDQIAREGREIAGRRDAARRTLDAHTCVRLHSQSPPCWTVEHEELAKASSALSHHAYEHHAALCSTVLSRGERIAALERALRDVSFAVHQSDPGPRLRDWIDRLARIDALLERKELT